MIVDQRNTVDVENKIFGDGMKCGSFLSGEGG
jgi:hypothetical protein